MSDGSLSPRTAGVLLFFCALGGAGLLALFVMTEKQSPERFHDKNGDVLYVEPGEVIDVDRTGRAYRRGGAAVPEGVAPPKPPPPRDWTPLRPAASNPATAPATAPARSPVTRPAAEPS